MQIVDYKKDVGNGYTNTLINFISRLSRFNNKTYYFANNDNRHFAFDADREYGSLYSSMSTQIEKIKRYQDLMSL